MTTESKKCHPRLRHVAWFGLFLAIGYHLFYIPYDQYTLVKKIEKSFNEASSETLKVSDFTDFEWDTLCLADMYSWFRVFKASGQGQLYYEKNYEALRWNLLAGWSPTFLANLIFIKDGRVVKTYVFDTLGLRYEKDRGWYTYTRIILNERSTFFWGEIPFMNDACISRENAAFAMDDSGQHESIIRVTNTAKDN